MKIKLFFLLPLLIIGACTNAPSNANQVKAKPAEELLIGTWKNEKDGAEITFYTDKIFTSKDAKGAKDGTYIIHDGKMIELQVKGEEKVQAEIISLTEDDLKVKDGGVAASYKRVA